MKCSCCKGEFSSDDFYAGQTRCKSCSKKLTYAWRKKNPEKVRAISRKSALKRTEARKRERKAYYNLNAERLKASERARYQKYKDAVYEAYGGYRCNCCGETERTFLSIDHVEGNGNEHRKIVNPRSLPYWLAKNGFPRGYQILCMNCQFGRKHNNGICPHMKAIYGIEI